MFSIPFTVERSITINKPVPEVFAHLANFNEWPKWSPWIIQEPTCPIKVSGEVGEVGHKQEWDGNRIGSGNMMIIEKQQNVALHYDLHFLKPWKSHSKTQFLFEQTKNEDGEEATTVKWAMQGTLPFFLFFMKKMMSVYVGGDYDRGLLMAKELIETGTVNSSVDITGTCEKEGFYYVGYRCACPTDKVGEAIAPAFQKLIKTELPQPDFVATVVNEFDLVKNHGDLVAAFAYRQKPNFTLPEGMIDGVQPPHKACEVIHTGSYRHIPNGWVTLVNYLRFAKLKTNKKAKEYEMYLNSPEDTAEAELKTAIISPIK